MDKFRRNRRTPPPTKSQSQYASSFGAASSSSSTTATTKFTIQQKVPAGAVKKGPYSVKRTVDPNEVYIKRRIGEGAKPLFSEDIKANRSISPKNKKAANSRSSSSSSSASSSSKSSSPADRRRSYKERSRSKSKKDKSVEKVPYFLDHKREKDRIKRIYGSRRSRSLSRGRRRSPPHYRRYRGSYSHRRTPSRDRYRSRHRNNYSRSRSRSRERRRRSFQRLQNGSYDEIQGAPPATQFIPVPVPVEYPYMPPGWGPPIMPPQPRFPFMMRLPMPAPVRFMPRPFQPMRYNTPNNYRGNFRPRY